MDPFASTSAVATGTVRAVAELKNVERVYQMGNNQVRALDDITCRFNEGDYWAIMGSSGSGKSTMLNLLGCIDRPTGGEYYVSGTPVSSLDDDELSELRGAHIGFIFQSFHLVPRLTAVQNVEMPMIFAGIAPSDRRRRAESSLAAVGLSDRLGHKPNELSGGQKQRVAIARSTVMDPGLLLADEPTGNLDSRSGAQVLDLLAELHAGGRTLVVVTHDPAVARRADRVVVMRDGEIVKRVQGQDISDLNGLFDISSEDDPSKQDLNTAREGDETEAVVPEKPV